MIKYIFGIIAIATVLVSCGGEDEANKKGDGKFYSTEVPDAEVLRVGIKQLEDSIMKMTKPGKDTRKVTNLLQQAYLEKLKLMFNAYPNDKDAPVSLEKVYMVYSGMGAAELSAKYADTLILKYPKYKGTWLALQSNAYYYDDEVVPRNKEKVRYYLEKLLKDYPNLDKEIIEATKFRLETIDLTFDELIEKQNSPS